MMFHQNRASSVLYSIAASDRHKPPYKQYSLGGFLKKGRFTLNCIFTFVIISMFLIGCGIKKNGVGDSSDNDADATPAAHIKEYAGNPIITSIFTADPSAHVWADGRIYIYASHDIDPSRGCDLMDRYHVFSSDDMVNWLDEGEILAADDVSWGRPEGGFMWAPDCAYKDGTYYFYYPHPSDTNWQDSWKIGVATSTDPKKDFVDQGYIDGVGGFAMIDPCVFIDDDGRAYLYYGGGGRLAGGELDDDMTSMKTDVVEIRGLKDFHEGAWVFKKDGTYYLVYPDNSPNGNKMHYATSTHPLGPYQYGDVILDSTGCDTSHGSVVLYKGQWYLFYHNQALSNNGTLRSMAVDLLEFDEQGHIKKVEQTRTGVANVGDGLPDHSISSTYSVTDAVLGNDAKLNTKYDESGDFVTLSKTVGSVTFNNVDGGDGGRAYVAIHYASGDNNISKISLTVNGKDYSLLNCFKTENNWYTFTGTTGLTVTLLPGETNAITLTGAESGVNVDEIQVSLLD